MHWYCHSCALPIDVRSWKLFKPWESPQSPLQSPHPCHLQLCASLLVRGRIPLIGKEIGPCSQLWQSSCPLRSQLVMLTCLIKFRYFPPSMRQGIMLMFLAQIVREARFQYFSLCTQLQWCTQRPVSSVITCEVLLVESLGMAICRCKYLFLVELFHTAICLYILLTHL